LLVLAAQLATAPRCGHPPLTPSQQRILECT